MASDQAFVAFKKDSIAQELALVSLQLTPNYKLSSKDVEIKEQLGQRFADSVSLPISKASAGAIQPPINHLRTELELVSQIQDESILSLLKGRPVTKQVYIEELQAQVSIFQVKHAIHTTNQKIVETTDEAALSDYKRLNAKRFSELRRLYKILDPDEETQQNQVLQAVSKQLQASKKVQKANLQQRNGGIKINTDFMRQLTASLSRSQRANKQALMERVRSDERAEQEEQRQAMR